MAIEYKKEWEKLKRTYGSNTIVYSGMKGMPTLGDLMHTQIGTTIGDREKLMEAYLKEIMTTDICKTAKKYITVKTFLYNVDCGTICVSRLNFEKWCEKKGGK